MKVSFQFYRSKRFFLQIVLTNFLLVGLFMTIFCLSIIMYSRDTTLNLQQAANGKVLNQVNYNIDHLNELIKTLAVSSFNDRDIVSLMNSREQEPFQLYNKLNKLDSIQNSNLFLNSIVVYNTFNKCSYSAALTSPVKCGSGYTIELERILENPQHYPKFTLIPLVVEEAGVKKQVFVYIMYASLGPNTGKESMLVLTVKPEWLFDNIKAINNQVDNSLGHIFLFSGNGEIIDSTDSPPLPEDTREIIASKLANAESSGYFTVKAQQGKQMVTYLLSQASKWKMVSVQPYHQVFGEINRIGVFSLIALFGLTVLSLIVSIFMSIKLYKPVRNLVNKFKKSPDSDARFPDKDEWWFMSAAYDQMSQSVEKLKTLGQAGKHIMKQYLLRQWIADSASITEQQFLENLASGRNFKSYSLCLFKIDNYSAFKTQRNDEEQKLVKFAILNIASEIMTEQYFNQTADMMNDQLVVVISPNDDTISPLSEEPPLIELIKKIQSTVYGYYNVSLTGVVSHPVAHYKELSAQYELIQRHSLYRMVLGKMSLITPAFDQSRRGKLGEKLLPMRLEAELTSAITANHGERIGQALKHTMQYIASLHCDSFDDAILHLLTLLKQAMREVDPMKFQSNMMSMQTYTRRVLEQETLDEVKKIIEVMLYEFFAERVEDKTDKPEYLIEAVKELVTASYSDPNLCLQLIADELELSPRYLGRYFRTRENISVAEFINETRLKQTLQLLEKESLSINEIMKKVGYNNESTFFNLFKKKIGMTPGEYRLNVSKV